ncbi:hypothetical protein HOLDEFILI_03127 [Holdemania filiformis DSM 12042]|uniref:Uncharacterized protein n=1 Tax=Holdemania filiformis DSM 12042 TaxID=545696 RepID=B9YBC0_9FIRM|nr:hypothetical protein HOLDEFILI_03127 [Holdemania filiformis DSM 12042]
MGQETRENTLKRWKSRNTAHAAIRKQLTRRKNKRSRILAFFIFDILHNRIEGERRK